MAFNEDYLRARRNIYTFCKMLRFEPTWQQRELFDCVQTECDAPPHKRKKRIAVKSGQGPGKSKAMGIVMAWRALRHIDGLSVVTAPTQRQVRDVFMAELSRTFAHAVPELQQLVDITHYKMMVMGRKDWGIKAVTSNKPENVQGYHQRNLTFGLDEASGISRPIWQTIFGTTTNPDSLVLAIGNPNDIDSGFYDCFYQSATLWHQFTWNAEESPDHVVDKSNLRRLEQEYGRESDVYRTRVLGQFPRQDPTCIISAEDVIYCSKLRQDILAREPLEGAEYQRQIGIDVARFGGDESTVYARRCRSIVSWKTFLGREPIDVAKYAFALQRELHWRDDDTLYVFDAGGMGQGIAHTFYDNEKQVMEFHGQGTPHDSVSFKDRISEGWFQVRGFTRERSIYLPKDDRLTHQLSTRKYDSQKGKIVIETKQQYKKRIGTEEATSPDRADGVVLAFYSNATALTQSAQNDDPVRNLGLKGRAG